MSFSASLYRTTVPVLFLFFFFLSLPTLSEAADGRSIFKAKKCASCHMIEGKSKARNVTDLTKERGPSLRYAGSKFREGFLETWLTSPRPIRPMEYYSLEVENLGNHPRLTKKEAKSVAAFLMTLKGEANLGISIKPKYSRQGRAIFEKKFGCYGCHLVKKEGMEVGGLSGPSLAGTSTRLRPEWIYSYLKDPKRFDSVITMPVIEGLASDKDLKTLVEFVSSLE